MITDLRDILTREKVKLHDLTIELCGDDINKALARSYKHNDRYKKQKKIVDELRDRVMAMPDWGLYL